MVIIFVGTFTSNLLAKKPEGIAPQFTETLKTLEVNEGSPAKLQCRVEGDPPPSTEWFKDGTKVKESRRVKAERDGNTACLSFKETLAADSAEYKCLASNDFGSVSCSTELTVRTLSKPDFKEKLKGVEILEGDTASFEVLISGHPEPKVEWFRGTTKLENVGRLEIIDSRDENRFRLNIGNVNQDDIGMYKCVASNEVGKATCRADLNVKERLFAPEFSEEELDSPLTVTEGDEVTLRVTISGKPKPDVRWYKDGRIIRDSNRLDIRARGGEYSMTILRIKSDDCGVYKCEAKSKMGTVTRTFDVRVAGLGITML